MNIEHFSTLCDLLRDPALLVTGDGLITAANTVAREELGDAICNSHVDDVFANNSQSLTAYLRNCARSRSPVRSTLQWLPSGSTDVRLFRCDGGVVEPRTGDVPAHVLWILKPHETGNLPFRILNEKIEELGQEIHRRRETESALQEHLALSEFGREFGLALSRAGELDEMLSRCAELLVRHMDAAFARIWVMNEGGDTLELRASAGMYTHLDGKHSRVPMGELKIGHIAKSQEPHLTNNVVGDPRVNEQEWAKREAMVAFAGYPLIVDGTTIGVMAVFARHTLEQNVLRAMALVANELSVGMSRKQAEANLKQKAEALELANVRKNEFLAMLAHELRNPLAPIRAGLDLLAADLPDNEVVEVMRPQLDHIVRIVDDLLDVSRIMRGRIEMRKRPVSMQEVLKRSLAAVQTAVDNAGHALHLLNIPQPLWVHGDEVRLTQAITNLIHNAVKYTPDNGTVEVSMEIKDSEVQLCVADNGIGFAPDFAPELFTLFTQATQALDRSQGGLGIGLTLVKQIIALHGGRIEAHSDGLDQGSQFTVYLPLCDEPPAQDENVDPEVEIPQFKVLVVDDNLASAKMLSRLIQRNWNHTLSTAYDGEQAISAAVENDPDIIFLDIGLPKIDGFQVARELRGRAQFADTMIVALTGYGTAEDRKASGEAGCNMHLVKPISIDDLRSIFSLAASARSNGDTT